MTAATEKGPGTRASSVVEVEGTIGERMPSERFSVITDEGYSVLAALSTRLSREAWNIKVGDRVTIQLTIDLPVPGRITRLAMPRTAIGSRPSNEAAPHLASRGTSRASGPITGEDS